VTLVSGFPFVEGLARKAEVSAGLGDAPGHVTGLPQQLQTPGNHSVLFILVHGLLLGWERSQNVSLVLGLHKPLTRSSKSLKNAGVQFGVQFCRSVIADLLFDLCAEKHATRQPKGGDRPDAVTPVLRVCFGRPAQLRFAIVSVLRPRESGERPANRLDLRVMSS
jgi:hypothetical protein